MSEFRDFWEGCEWGYEEDVDRERMTHDIIEYFLDRILQMFRVEGLPEDSMPERWVKRLVLIHGAVPVGPHDGKLWATRATFGGERNGYYVPRRVIITNPWIPWYDEIDTPSDRIVIWENDTQRRGLLPILVKYARALTDNYITMRMINVNSRCPAVLASDDRETRSSAEEFFKKLWKGSSGIITTKEFSEGLTSTPYADSGKTSLKDAIEYEQYLTAKLWNELGVQSNWNAKREALHSDEVGMNLDSLLPLVDEMLECWQRAADEISDKFPEYLPDGRVTVRKNSAWQEVEKEVDLDENNDAADPVPDVDDQRDSGDLDSPAATG